ncbi:MAG: hypothetical protein LBR15_07270 [Methanobrevibacter sp.]|jgi:hypothetical protein|nr:hypothetical protein [Candidatus Methanovirga australis]
MNNKIYGILIVLLLAISLSASAASIPNVNTENRNSNIINTTPKTSNVPYTTVNDQSMNYAQLLNYLLVTKESDQPNYIVCNGSGTNLSTYTFTISTTPLDDYHSLSDNYKDVSLSDSKWKGTLVYTPEDYNLKSIFITNNDDNIDTINYATFKQDLRNTQFWKAPKFEVSFPEFPLTDKELEDIANDDKATILNKLATINHWCIYMKTSYTDFGSLKETTLYTVHNKYVAAARSGNYSSGIGGYFEDVDDNSLEIIAMYDQSMKIPLDKVRFSLSGINLDLDDVVHLLEVANVAIPSDFGMDKPLKFTICGLKGIQLYIKDLNNYATEIFYELDQETMDISAEKDYRSLIKDGLIIPPKDPTHDEISKQFINNKIGRLNEYRDYVHENFNDSESTKMYNHFSNQIDSMINYLEKYLQ